MATKVLVSATYRAADDVPASGRVSFQLTAPLLDAAGDVVYDTAPVKVRLDATGSFSVELVATDDPSLQPEGVTYTVTESIRHADPREWTLQVPLAAAGTGLDLADVAPAVAGPEEYSYATTAALAAETAERVAGDEALDGRLVVVEEIAGDIATGTALTAEVSRATASETGLDGRLDTVEGTLPTKADVSALSAEVTRATAAENGLDGRLDTVETALPLKADLVGGVVPDAQIPPGITRDAELNAALAALLNGAPAALDTLNEIAQRLIDEEGAGDALLAALSDETTRATAAEASLTASLLSLDSDLGDAQAALLTKVGKDEMVYNVLDHGLVNDGFIWTGGSTTAGSNVVRLINSLQTGVTTPPDWDPAYIGKPCVIAGAGPAGVPLVTTVTGPGPDRDSITVADAPSVTIVDTAFVSYGTDNSAALQALIDSFPSHYDTSTPRVYADPGVAGQRVFFPPGGYFFTSTVSKNVSGSGLLPAVVFEGIPFVNNTDQGPPSQATLISGVVNGDLLQFLGDAGVTIFNGATQFEGLAFLDGTGADGFSVGTGTMLHLRGFRFSMVNQCVFRYAAYGVKMEDAGNAYVTRSYFSDCTSGIYGGSANGSNFFGTLMQNVFVVNQGGVGIDITTPATAMTHIGFNQVTCNGNAVGVRVNEQLTMMIGNRVVTSTGDGAVCIDITNSNSTRPVMLLANFVNISQATAVGIRINAGTQNTVLIGNATAAGGAALANNRVADNGTGTVMFDALGFGMRAAAQAIAGGNLTLSVTASPVQAIDASGMTASRNVRLPQASVVKGRFFYLVRTDAGATPLTRTLTIQPELATDQPAGVTIGGAATWPLNPRSAVALYCDGTNWQVVGITDTTTEVALNGATVARRSKVNLTSSGGVISVTDDPTNDQVTINFSGAPAAAADVQVFTGNGTWIKPAGVTMVEITTVAASSGAGSGRRGGAGTVRCGGGASGAGGITTTLVRASLLGATEPVVVGSKGLGGAAVTTDNTNGNSGTTGGASTFGSPVRARANASSAGSGGTATTGAAGTGGMGASPGGSGGAASTTGGPGAAGATTGSVGSGGGAGGGISSADVASAGGAGSVGAFAPTAGAAGAVGAAGGNGSDSTTAGLGAGGGGGGASTTGPAGAGGNGGNPGGGAAGGGASLNGFASGKGGDGADGYVIVRSW